MDKRFAIIRIKGKLLYTTPVCGNTPKEEKDYVIKDVFYKRMEHTHMRCSHHDVKMVLGDFNVRVSRLNVVKYNLHNETYTNALRLIDYAGSRNIVVFSTRLQREKKHKATGLSSDRRKTKSAHCCYYKRKTNLQCYWRAYTSGTEYRLGSLVCCSKDMPPPMKWSLIIAVNQIFQQQQQCTILQLRKTLFSTGKYWHFPNFMMSFLKRL